VADTSIEWTQKVWNPIVGCTIHSPGCKNCYAMRMAWRLQGMAQKPDGAGNPALAHYEGTVEQSRAGPVWTGKINVAPDDVLTAPLRRKKPTTYFVNSMSDLFHADVPDEIIDRVFAVMALCRQHTLQVLTKRADRMRSYCDSVTSGIRAARVASQIVRVGGTNADAHAWMDQIAEHSCLPNVWLGVSVEDQKRADERVPDLLATPAAVRWLSCEPLLGPVDLRCINARTERGAVLLDALWGFIRQDGPPVGGQPANGKLHWVVAGGESGKGARGSADEVERNMRVLLAQCRAAGVPFFGKQNFRKLPLPDDLIVREIPNFPKETGRG
jgi:protein gp37